MIKNSLVRGEKFTSPKNYTCEAMRTLFPLVKRGGTSIVFTWMLWIGKYWSSGVDRSQHGWIEIQ